jgi:hypothetical protein
MRFSIVTFVQLGGRIEYVRLTPYQYEQLTKFGFEPEYDDAFKEPPSEPTFHEFNWLGRWRGWTILEAQSYLQLTPKQYDEAVDVTDVMIAYFMTTRENYGMLQSVWTAALQDEVSATAYQADVVQALYTRARKTPFGCINWYSMGLGYEAEFYPKPCE